MDLQLRTDKRIAIIYRQRLKLFKVDYIKISLRMEGENWNQLFKGMDLLQSWAGSAKLCEDYTGEQF